MYVHSASLGAGTSASLAATGYNSLALILAGASLIIGGIGLIRLVRPSKVEI
jgi:predicted phage tail protein